MLLSKTHIIVHFQVLTYEHRKISSATYVYPARSRALPASRLGFLCLIIAILLWDQLHFPSQGCSDTYLCLGRRSSRSFYSSSATAAVKNGHTSSYAHTDG